MWHHRPRMPPTKKSLGPFPSRLSDPGRRRSVRPDFASEDRVGIVFVHGIGSQKAGETLLQWSAPIIEILTDWWRWPNPNPADRSLPGATPDEPDDPVIEAAIDLESPLPTVTVRVPATAFPDATYRATEWVMTEAWWASKVSPPSLSTMTSWLGPGGAAGRIVDAILANRAAGNRWLFLARAFLVPFTTILAAIILAGYALVRGIIGVIPIQSLKDAAILRTFDEFLVGWFGDARILLYDPAQSANIRAGLADAVLRLRDTCDRVVVVAHSGGVMVSYLTLTDPALVEQVQVDKLITFGEGWNLALQLTGDHGGMWDRLRANLVNAQPALRWQDFYASNDPAPAGPPKTDQTIPPMEPHPRIRSDEVWNRRSVLDDHGGYFDNDEEFTIRVMQEIDVPSGWGETSRFYRPDAIPSPSPGLAAEPRVRRHRQRVVLLALWRHVVVVLGVTTVALALRFEPGRLVDIGGAIARWFPADLPVVRGLIDAVRTFSTTWLDSVTIDLPGLAPTQPGWVGATAGSIGLGVLQGVVPISALYLAAALPQAYLAWPGGSRTRAGVALVELAGTIVVLASVVLLFVPGHDRLLGTGDAWRPGLIVTLGILAVTFLGTWIASNLRVPLIANAYAAVSSVIFVVALACSVVAIFRLPEVATAELAYMAIWIGAYVVLSVGRARWTGWDRVERQVARGPLGDVAVERRPVVATSLGMVLISICLIGLVMFGPTAGVEATGVVGIVAIIVGMAWGAAAWRHYGNPVAAPGPVETGGV